MRISDWSSDVCSSDLEAPHRAVGFGTGGSPTMRDDAGRADPRRPGTDQVDMNRSAAVRSAQHVHVEIGKERCRGRVGLDVTISGVDGSLKQKKNNRS